MSSGEPQLSLRVAKGDKNFVLQLPTSATVAELRRRVHAVTGVPTTHQKLVGLPKNAAANDETTLAQLNLKQNHRIVVFRTANAVVNANVATPSTSTTTTTTSNPADARIEEALLTVRSAVDALEQRVASAVASRDAAQLRVCVAELERLTLALDELRSDNDAIRGARKAEVTRIQAMLAQLDAAAASNSSLQ
jgi:hypothetical protein